MDLLTPTRKQLSDWAKLSQKKYRRELGQFLIEGNVCVSEALVSGIALESILMLSGKDEIFDKLPPTKRVPVYQLNSDNFHRISSVETSQGIAAAAKIFSLPARKSSIALACEQVADPGNCGALLRVADFFSASEVFLGSGSTEIWNSKVVRGSMGSVFHQPVREGADLENIIRAWPGSTVATVARGGKSLRTKPKLKLPILLVLGNETRGLSPELEALCSDKITLKPLGAAESLNLVTAAAVFAYALTT